MLREWTGIVPVLPSSRTAEPVTGSQQHWEVLEFLLVPNLDFSWELLCGPFLQDNGCYVP